MKALTLWQPWATLIALGEKTIETRSWATNYRGPIAIHAAKRWEKVVLDPDGDQPWSAADRGFAYPVLDRWSVEEQRFVSYRLPLGAVVATANLVDVVRFTGGTDCAGRPWINGGPASVDLDQLPYGDYSPGRYGWLLDDIVALDEPIPARGAQQLWEWNQEVAAGG